MKEILKELGEEVRETEEELRKIERSLIRRKVKAEGARKPVDEDLPIALELCQAARNEARRYGRAPFRPPALRRHQGLERIAHKTAEARRKKGGLGLI